MLDNSQVVALRGLVLGYEEATEAGRWPTSAAREVTLLGDVCVALGATAAQVAEVLGPEVAAFVAAAAEAPA